VRKSDCVIERIAVRHQSSCGEDSVPVRFDDSFIDVFGEAEIVGIDYEPCCFH
jgi:hypothetical protein